MATSYPSGIDNFTNPTSTDSLDSATVPHAEQHTNANDAIEAIEAELGTLPKGAKATVKARLDDVDTAITGRVATTTTISTTAPLTGGGDLSANRTFAVSAASTSASGVVQLSDSTSTTSSVLAATPTAVKAAYDLALLHPVLKLQSGKYRRTPYGASANFGVSNNITYYTPVYFAESTTLDRIACRTGTFNAATTVRLGIYSNSAGLPSSLILDAGTISAVAASTDYLITISQTLAAGVYWLAFNATNLTTTNFVGAAAGGFSVYNPLMMSSDTTTGNGNSAYSQSVNVTSAFPSTASSLTQASTFIYTFVRAA